MVHEGRSNPAESRIIIITYPEAGIDVPITCQQCQQAPCIAACAMNAIHRDESTGAVIVNEDECTRCDLCITACPIGAIAINPITDKITMCDLCSGDPLCVKFCTVDALKYVPLDEAGARQRGETVKDFAAWVEERVG